MLKYLAFTGFLYVIITPVLSLIDLSFVHATDTAISSIISNTFFSSGIVTTPLTWINAIWSLITFNYVSLGDGWEWVRFALGAIVAFPIVYGILMNIRGTSAA